MTLFFNSDNIIANNEQTSIEEVALATDAIGMNINPEVSIVIKVTSVIIGCLVTLNSL